jgi:hypothetical protein
VSGRRRRIVELIRCSVARVRLRGESGQITLLVLGFSVVAILLIVGTLAVTSVQLSRMRLLDAADGAALDAADALDTAAYERGLGGSVALSGSTVRQAATAYLKGQPRPASIRAWGLANGTGSPDGQTAVVRLTGEADISLMGGVLDGLGGSLSITVESRARAPLG